MKKEVGIATIFILIIASFSGCIEESENQKPTVSIIYPENGDIVSGIVNISGNASDEDGNVQSVEVQIESITNFDHGAHFFTFWQPANGTTEWYYCWNSTVFLDGIYSIHARGYDGRNYSDIATVNVTVKNTEFNHPPVASLSVSSSSGYAPLNVTFQINGYDADGNITSWSLDVNSDNAPEFIGYTPDGCSFPKTINYTYIAAGNYTAKFVVSDNNGSKDTSTVTIEVLAPAQNNPPSCSISANLTSGTAPLAVTFSMSASDTDGNIASWVLDTDDDGTPDYSGTGDPPSTEQHTYSIAGDYTAKLTVTDNMGGANSCSIQITVSPQAGEYNFTIASWNLQIFGVTKASNETLLDYYADKIDNYDICIVQEIRDKSGTAIQELAAKLPEYHYIISERAGTTSSKEQYAIFYDGRAVLINYHDYTPEKQNEFERPPLEATFTVSNWTFTLYTIHTKPSNVPNELTNLENLTGEPSADTLILGDLNADGSYYDENDREQFINWDWVITNDMDTTVASSDNTYDRIIINNAVENNLISVGIMKDVTKDESDHYLIYAVFDSGAI